ncbi:hypothetical protein IG193_03510 [Infirmifilum lucidum]|uniref:Uncharacterized protein n=1 Tax=Infirmifilum lucidum TaxID=2776706 RepID=A0A7L9FIJ9_9CREN|nr:hypothetical protein [Infirmifilum lucidum]QOJ79537.1 hypothetical protein IG193_03510 [Infirmifilum lucidum]
MRVEVFYGEECPSGTFSVTPSGELPPWTYGPEWLLAQALEHDMPLRRPGRLVTLLLDAPGPHTVWKAAAVEPDDWWEILKVAVYTGEPRQGQSVQLLPFAPATSTLSAIGQREVCIHAESISRSFLASLIHALSASGTERLVLANPPFITQWQSLKASGVVGYSLSRRALLPRVIQLRALARADFDVEKGEFSGGSPITCKYPERSKQPDLVKLAFGGESELARAILSELEASGGVVSYRAFMDTSSSLDPRGKSIARRLILYGYVALRQAQVELAEKGLYVLLY